MDQNLENNITVGCIFTDAGLESLRHEEVNNYVYQTVSGVWERISVTPADDQLMQPIAVKQDFLEVLHNHVATKLEVQGYSLDGLIYTAEGLYVICSMSDGIIFKCDLPDCEILGLNAGQLLVSDCEED